MMDRTTLNFTSRFQLAIPLTLTFFLVGCATPGAKEARDAFHSYTRGDYLRAQDELRPLAAQTNENFVLNNCRLGSASLATYDLNTAETSFLAAYQVLNSVGTNDAARGAAAVIINEQIRVWRGEPFERAMANYYLGLVYYMKGDYDNARAAFENSLFKLRDYGEDDKEDKYQAVESNFALGYLMLAKCWQRLGDDDKAAKNFDRVRQLRSYLSPVADPRLHARSNLLLVVDFGYGPKKTTNSEGTFVGFTPTVGDVGPVPPPTVTVDGQTFSVGEIGRPPVDLLALAQDRHWQSLDTVRTIKSALGYGLMGVGAYEATRSRNRSNQLAGVAMIGAGLLVKASSTADTRYWEELPRTSLIIPLEVPPGTHQVRVDFPVAGLSQTWIGLTVPEKGESTYYFRMQRYQTGPFTYPPAPRGSQPPIAVNY